MTKLAYVDDEFEDFWNRNYTNTNYRKSEVRCSYFALLDKFERTSIAEYKTLNQYPVKCSPSQ